AKELNIDLENERNSDEGSRRIMAGRPSEGMSLFEDWFQSDDSDSSSNSWVLC
ncbi:hypothetical protein FRC16_009592, partial [Serendipita sp. 398]